LIAGYLMYFLYKYVKGTAAVNIFIGIVLFFILLTVVTQLKMRLLSLMLGSVAGIGLIGLIVIFQPEIRRVLLMIGDNTLKGRFGYFDKLFKQTGLDISSHAKKLTDDIITAVADLSKTKTGALLILSKSDIPAIAKTGRVIDAKVSSILLENIFFKNAPLHDGAVIVKDDRVVAASCILPVSSNPDLPPDVGLRHRAALGATEGANLLSVIVSEENGQFSYALDGKLFQNVTLDELKIKINRYYAELE